MGYFGDHFEVFKGTGAILGEIEVRGNHFVYLRGTGGLFRWLKVVFRVFLRKRGPFLCVVMGFGYGYFNGYFKGCGDHFGNFKGAGPQPQPFT